MIEEAIGHNSSIDVRHVPGCKSPECMSIVAAVVLVCIAAIVPARALAQTFNDAPPNHWAFPFVETLASIGITGGCASDKYCPDDPVTRGQMAVFLERGMRGSSFVPPPASGNVFLDVGANDFASSFIEQLFIDGITSGCGNNNYCPDDAVTRAQMAVFLLRAKHGADYTPPPSAGIFDDVDLSYWAAAWIEQLANEDITSGCGGGSYCPEDVITRAQMAVFLVRTFDLVISPGAATAYPLGWIMPVGEQIQFRTNIVGPVEWSVNGIVDGSNEVGTIDSTGWYIAPDSVPSPNFVTVRADFLADASVTVDAQVTITSPPTFHQLSWHLWTPKVAQRGTDTILTLDVGISGYPRFEFERWDGVRIQPVALSNGRYRFYISTSDVLTDHELGDLKNVAGIMHCDVCTRPLNAFGQVEIPVLDESIPATTVYPLDDSAQAASHVLNVRQNGTPSGFSWPLASRKFYEYFPDEFDFITLVQAVSRYLNGGGTGIASGGHRRNDITGIGVELYDYPFDYGSAGRLHGAVQFGWAAGFDYAGPLFLHELGHSWAAFLHQPPVNAGAHWPFASTFTEGMLGSRLVFLFVPMGGDIFEIVCPPGGRVEEYSDVELYLMGLIGPANVAPQFVARDPSIFACTRTVEADTVTIDDIIAQYGVRTPDHTVSRKHFAMATVVYSKDRLLTPEEMAWFNHMSQRGEALSPLPIKLTNVGRTTVNPFYVATGARATLSTRIVSE